MREGGASIVVGFMTGVLTWCGIKICWIGKIFAYD